MEATTLNIPLHDPLAVAVGQAIRAGEVGELKRLLAATPGLALSRIVDTGGVARTLLHVVADWPGHFPNGAATVELLAEAGADVNARVVTPDAAKPAETPLHWAASSDDVAVLDALLDEGADIEASGACIAGGTALDDAVAFAQWNAARRLVARGAQTTLWHSAALGMLEDVETKLSGHTTQARYRWGTSAGAIPDDVTVAFWCACHGGQQEYAEYLLDKAAQLNWISPWDGLLRSTRPGALAPTNWSSGCAVRARRLPGRLYEHHRRSRPQRGRGVLLHVHRPGSPRRYLRAARGAAGRDARRSCARSRTSNRSPGTPRTSGRFVRWSAT